MRVNGVRSLYVARVRSLDHWLDLRYVSVGLSRKELRIIRLQTFVTRIKMNLMSPSMNGERKSYQTA